MPEKTTLGVVLPPLVDEALRRVCRCICVAGPGRNDNCEGWHIAPTLGALNFGLGSIYNVVWLNYVGVGMCGAKVHETIL